MAYGIGLGDFTILGLRARSLGVFGFSGSQMLGFVSDITQGRARLHRIPWL